MDLRFERKYFLLFLFLMSYVGILAEDKVPLGIHYQAVARDNFGNELVNKKISVRFSIISGNPLGTVVYQELHQDVFTSKFGVFSLVIGNGVPTGNTRYSALSEVRWETTNHYLKVDVKFDNDFMDMGTMQFLAVPYALYAQKSLEPGPTGPKGDAGPKGEPGDPASDNQTLSVVNIDGSDYLALSGGNQVKISTIERDGDPANEIQDLIYDGTKRELRLTKSSYPAIDLTELKNDADADPANEIQDLKLSGDKLSVTGKTGATEINLAVYRDNTDNQLLTYSEANNSLSVSGGNSVVLGNMVAFRVKKTESTSAPMPLSNVDFVPDQVEYNDGNGIKATTGEFTALYTGIYSFDIKYVAPGSGDGRMVMIYKNGNLYETLGTNISSGSILFRTLTLKLTASDKFKLVIHTGTGTEIGTGTFAGYKVY